MATSFSFESTNRQKNKRKCSPKHKKGEFASSVKQKSACLILLRNLLKDVAIRSATQQVQSYVRYCPCTKQGINNGSGASEIRQDSHSKYKTKIFPDFAPAGSCVATQKKRAGFYKSCGIISVSWRKASCHRHHLPGKENPYRHQNLSTLDCFVSNAYSHSMVPLAPTPAQSFFFAIFKG